MPQRRLLTLLALLVAAWSVDPASAQQPEPGAFQPGDRVEAEYIPSSNRWLAATVVEVLNDGYSYKVELAAGDDGRLTQTNIHFRRVRPASAAAPATAIERRPAEPRAGSAPLVAGRYACTSSTYSAASGSYEYTPRGTLVLSGDGTYRYLGFRKPSTGRFQLDRASGAAAFRGGYLDRGEATPMADRPGRFYLVSPTLPGNRWTCGPA